MRATILILVLALGSCGGGGGDGDGYVSIDCPDGDDCIDSDPLSFPREPEGGYGCLDGIDNNCDDTVDNPVRMLDPDLAVSFGGTIVDHGQHPDIQWTGSSYAVAFDSHYDVLPSEEDQDLYVFNVGPTGTWRPADTSELTDDVAFDFKPQIAWTGSQFGVVWRAEGPETDSGNAIYLDILDLSGTSQLTEPLVVGDTLDNLHDQWPDLAWSGTRFAVTWQVKDESSPPADIAFMTVTPEGALGLTEPLMLTSATTTRNVFGRVTWASSTWIATWSETED